MDFIKKYKSMYIFLKISTLILVLAFNVQSIDNWKYAPLFSLLIISSLLNIFIMRKSVGRLLKVNKIKIKIWGNYLIWNIILWQIGGVNNFSYHLLHIFLVVSSISMIDRLHGLLMIFISSAVYFMLMIYGKVGFDYFITFLYFMFASAFIGFFIEFHNKKSKTLDKKVKEFEALYKISKIIDTFPSTQVIFDNIVEIVAKTLGIDECLIMLYDEENDILSTKARYGNINPEMRNAVFAKGEGVSGKVLETKKSVISSDLFKDTDILNSFKYNFNIRSCAIVPLIHNNKAIGVIAVYSTDKYEFTKETVELLDIIASRICNVLENNRLYKMVKINSITDGLTKLYNHRYFYETLKRELEIAKEYSTRLFLLMIDIDRFKHFNDKYGHIVGDKVLKEIASIIIDNIRKTDIAARYGGEEFAVILPNSDREIAEKVAKRIKEKVKLVGRKIKELKSEDLEISVSIGIACYPHCAKDITALIEIADMRMYYVKEIGGDNAAYEVAASEY